MKQKKSAIVLPLCLGGVFTLLFLALMILLKTLDVDAIGPAGTSVGLSHINGPFHEWIPFNETWYTITTVIGIVGLAVAAGAAIWSLVQLIRRKSIWKVDKTLLALDFLYAATGVLYLLFEFVVINYRPILMEGQTMPSVSFPSSHTLLSCVIFGSAFWLAFTYLRKGWQIAGIAGAGVLLVLTVIGRMLAGVHWLSDIWAGLLLGAALICFFHALLTKLEERQEAGSENGETGSEP